MGTDSNGKRENLRAVLINIKVNGRRHLNTSKKTCTILMSPHDTFHISMLVVGYLHWPFTRSYPCVGNRQLLFSIKLNNVHKHNVPIKTEIESTILMRGLSQKACRSLDLFETV